MNSPRPVRMGRKIILWRTHQKKKNRDPTSVVPIRITDLISIVIAKIPDPTSIAICNSGQNSDGVIIMLTYICYCVIL